VRALSSSSRASPAGGELLSKMNLAPYEYPIVIRRKVGERVLDELWLWWMAASVQPEGQEVGVGERAQAPGRCRWGMPPRCVNLRGHVTADQRCGVLLVALADRGTGADREAGVSASPMPIFWWC